MSATTQFFAYMPLTGQPYGDFTGKNPFVPPVAVGDGDSSFVPSSLARSSFVPSSHHHSSFGGSSHSMFRRLFARRAWRTA